MEKYHLILETLIEHNSLIFYPNQTNFRRKLHRKMQGTWINVQMDEKSSVSTHTNGSELPTKYLLKHLNYGGSWCNLDHLSWILRMFGCWSILFDLACYKFHAMYTWSLDVEQCSCDESWSLLHFSKIERKW